MLFPMKRRATTRGAARNATRTGFRSVRCDGLEILQSPALDRLSWLVHGFTTRTGGGSRLNSECVLNLESVEWDKRAAIEANRKKLLAALDASGMRLVTQRQFHSDLVRQYKQAPGPGLRGDAHFTRAPGLLLAVKTADCVPILLADPKHKAVAAVHAGWRGTLKRIVAKTLGQMQMAFGTRPADVLAALGPSIGGCCYEVGPEVVQAFAAQFADAKEWFEPTDTGPHGRMATFETLVSSDTPNPLKWLSMAPPGHDPPPPRLKFDLIAANRWQLLDAGVRAAHIAASGLCTACRVDLLFSHRREHGRTGRMMGAIGIRPQ